MPPPPLLLPPPPPRRIDCVKDGNEEEEEIKEMVGGDSSTINECIPDEMLFEILLRLPAQDIYFAARLVCRKWYDMTRTNNFVHKHLEHASYGLLYGGPFRDDVFISARDDGGIETRKMNSYGFRCLVWSVTWNGLMLEFYKTFDKVVYYNVVNVSTGQTFCLPPFPKNHYFVGFSGIGYDAASKRYKVVVLLKKSFECAILTVGVDKSWRTICTNHLSVLGRQTLIGFPIITEGFVHWNGFYTTYMVTLNLETEIIVETPPPIPKVEANTRCCCFSTGRYVTFFINRGKLVWEALEMKPETGEWRKLANICLEGTKVEIERLGDVKIEPFGWLKYPEVLALKTRRNSIVFYNRITCEIGPEKLSVSDDSWVTLHKKSLVLSSSKHTVEG